MSGTVDDVIKLAKEQVGYDRFKDPEQGTKYGRWYAEYTGEAWCGQNGVPYCAMFVSWVLYHADVTCPWFPNAVAFDTHDRDILGTQFVDKYRLKIGDIVGFDWNVDTWGDHVGIVIDVYEDYVKTIEGNTDNGKVKERYRGYAEITCGVRPFYSADALRVTGIWDRATTIALQKDFGTVEDGVVSGQSSWACNNPGIKAGGCFNHGNGGSQLIMEMQKWLGVEADGYFGPITCKALMQAMQVPIEYPIEISKPSITITRIQQALIKRGTIQ